MKKMTCGDMSGGLIPCTQELTGATPEELGNAGKEHLMAMDDEGHNKMKEMMKTSSQEEKDKWSKEFTEKFDSLQEA